MTSPPQPPPLRQPTRDAPDGAARSRICSPSSVAPDSGVKAVAVKKRRVRYTIGGCTAERSDVEADGHKIRTIAIEDPDPDKVITAVRDIGLGAYLNRSYVAGLPRCHRRCARALRRHRLRHELDQAPPRRANGRRQVAPRARPGRGDPAGRGPGAQRQHRLRCGRADRRRHRRHGGRVEGGGGAGHRRGRYRGLRIAKNSAEVVAALERAGAIHLEVISGEEESRLAYVGATAELVPSGSVVVFDTGGGSSQFTFGHGHEVDERFSLEVGAVRYTETFGLAGAVSAEVVGEARAAIAADLARLDGRPQPDALIGMGGALTNMTAVALGMTAYDPDRVHGARLDTRRDRPSDRAVPIDRCGRPPIHPRAPARPRRGDPGRRVHRAHRHGPARVRRTDRQRSGTAPRGPARTLRVALPTPDGPPGRGRPIVPSSRRGSARMCSALSRLPGNRRETRRAVTSQEATQWPPRPSPRSRSRSVAASTS